MGTAVSFRASGGFLVMAAVWFLLLPLELLGAMLLAAVSHELCHWAALRLLGGKLRSVTIRPGGAVMECGALSPIREILCAAAGPAGSLILTLPRQQFPLLALCGFVQGVFNLLPVYPLDGGRILKCLLRLIPPLPCQFFGKIPCKRSRNRLQ